MQKVMHIVSALGSGGVESLLYSYYSLMDKDKLNFAFVTHRSPGLYEEKLLSMGVNEIHHLSFRRNHPIKSALEAYILFKKNKSNIIHFHGHKEVIFQLMASVFARKKVRIVHLHNPVVSKNKFEFILNKIFDGIIFVFATDLLASSHLTSATVLGQNKYKIMKNAIDVDRYKFDNSKRAEVRRKFGVEEKFVVGHIGRFTSQKNHTFLLEIFCKVYQKNQNALLFLVGEGEDEAAIINKAKELKIETAIKFLGVRSDIPELMQAMDVFLFPSKFEGLGIVLIEAQASGLQCIASEGVIPKETAITEYIKYISLAETSDYWADKVVEYSRGYPRIDTSEVINDAGYNIVEQSKWLENYYELRS